MTVGAVAHVLARHLASYLGILVVAMTSFALGGFWADSYDCIAFPRRNTPFVASETAEFLSVVLLPYVVLVRESLHARAPRRLELGLDHGGPMTRRTG